jgi:hypothetical protein
MIVFDAYSASEVRPIRTATRSFWRGPRRLNREFRLTARQITLPRPDEDVHVDL